MQKLDMTWRRTVSVSWLLMWRGAIGFALLGICLGFVISGYGMAAIAEFLGIPTNILLHAERIVGVLACLVVGAVWTLIVTTVALRNKYREFQIILIPRTGGTST